MPRSARRPTPATIADTAEGRRLEAARRSPDWRRWGPYLSERQWGTVREDYSADGDAWAYLPHDHARSRAYRWGEDGIGGFGDDKTKLCLGLALWNGRDPFLKERLFGLTNPQGNHGEDVKELYYYLDGIPTHSYMRMLYKYPQGAFPYDDLIAENKRRGVGQPEYELLDTGLFDENRYFDVEIEYAKANGDDILMQVTVTNRAAEAAELHLLPQLWARNIWSWRPVKRRPLFTEIGPGTVRVTHPSLPEMQLVAEGDGTLLFCDNDTNTRRLSQTDALGYFKDGINDYVVGGDASAINPAREGTKLAVHHRLMVPAGGSAQVRLRLSAEAPQGDFDTVMAARRADADEFYAVVQRGIDDPDARRVQRQALAGLLWSKQFYQFDVPQWLAGDPDQPPPPASRLNGRDARWVHLNNADVILMPDTWEYPWYASWDLAFHCVTMALIDPEFAKDQLILLTREWYMHPNGQLPAYEWAFGDVNPPVHAWAAWRVYRMDRERNGGVGDRPFLERVFHKLMVNFTWWVNRKDSEGRNIFEGGFLGLDNIGIFDRSKPLPTGGEIRQSDGTAWMAMYTLNLMRIALELAEENPVYQDIATKFFEHFLYIADAMTRIGGEDLGLWDEADQFFYDVLNLPGGQRVPLRVRSMVGLIPLFAVEVIDGEMLDRLPDFAARLDWFLKHRPELAELVSRWTDKGRGERQLLSLLRGHRLKQLLRRMLDETEFLSDHGIRSLSKIHEQHPYVFEHAGQEFSVGYQPGVSASYLFGGNSNWRGPVWMPVNFLIIEALLEHHEYYGDDFKVECPVGSETYLSLKEVAGELSCRLARLFLRDDRGRRALHGDSERQQSDPAFRDHVLFHEYFHGDTGLGLGASHQTGWTALIALLLQPRSENNCPFVVEAPSAVGETKAE
ncbi:MAG TPA: glucosidase [Aliidongia sp.]|uniref:MGH1-like glycoside hydrolase domain-containing protein n=1 Tax=Aliidongia sp. TaxID=1914230 RepID=UPI002DDCCA1B|nr:glucosidase [Aliidongia sp.]HEV2677461.1 glucosidase [Aliidongia sp.]